MSSRSLFYFILAVLLTYGGTNLSMYTLMGRCSFYHGMMQLLIFSSTVSPGGPGLSLFIRKLLGVPHPWIPPRMGRASSANKLLHGPLRVDGQGPETYSIERVIFTTSDQIWPFFRHKTLQIFIIKRKAL